MIIQLINPINYYTHITTNFKHIDLRPTLTIVQLFCITEQILILVIQKLVNQKLILFFCWNILCCYWMKVLRINYYSKSFDLDDISINRSIFKSNLFGAVTANIQYILKLTFADTFVFAMIRAKTFVSYLLYSVSSCEVLHKNISTKEISIDIID